MYVVLRLELRGVKVLNVDATGNINARRRLTFISLITPKTTGRSDRR